MICGFNPFSGWGVRRAFAKYVGRQEFPPQTQRMLSERRLRDWVKLLGFDVDSVYGYLGLLPTKGRLPGDAERPAARVVDDGRLLAQGAQAGPHHDAGAAAAAGAPARPGRRSGADHET